jgi:hypothetical protein
VVGEVTQHLPNAIGAVVEERRVREHLLDVAHVTGGPKARFFIAHGFAPDAWDLLQASLLAQGRANLVIRTAETMCGPRFTVRCNCPTPDGRNPCIRIAWQIEDHVARLLHAATVTVLSTPMVRVAPPTNTMPQSAF